MDYKKAFDLVDHHLLISKLKALGIHKEYLPLFTSYLRGHRQYVNINGCRSRPERVNSGVPQGSILGPVLFLIFINDLPTVLKKSIANIYSDDTTINYSTSKKIAPQALRNGLKLDIEDLQKCLNANRMTLNENNA